MENLTVTFTLKEVLLRIESEIREIRGVFTGRVDAQDAKIDDHEKRISFMEHEKANRGTIRDNALALFATLAAIAAGLGTIGLWLHG